MTGSKMEFVTLLTGATGFIGSSILEALLHIPTQVAALSRTPLRRPRHERVAHVSGDITDRASIRKYCLRSDVVIHAASYFGPDALRNSKVNVEGTRNIADCAREAGGPNLIYISSSAVYGNGPHRGAREGHLALQPQSPTSTSRVVAESIVLEAGGTVVRPNLIYGAGDRWFIPGLITITKRCGASIEDGRAKISLISATELGYLVARLAESRLTAVREPQVFHAAIPTPVALSKIASEVNHKIVHINAKNHVTYDEAVKMAASLGFTEHQVSMLALDNWYNSDRIWKETRTHVPAQDFRITAGAANWYRNYLGTA